MDWCKAYEGLMFIDMEIDNHPAVNGLLSAIFDLCRSQLEYDDCGGRYAPETIEEMEPTYENSWDYEWPTDFPPPHYKEWQS